MTRTLQMEQLNQYAIRHPDGRWLYHLPNPSCFYSTPRIGTYADGRPMTPLAGHRGVWWVSDHQAETITAVFQPSPKPIGYRLKDTAVLSDRYPSELSVEDWHEQTDDDDTYYRFYEAVTEDQPEVRHEYPGPFIVLQGSEPPAGGALPWVATMPLSLTERPEYLHCFPGRIEGLRAHLKGVIGRMRHVQYCLDGRDGKPAGLYVTIRVPFEKPVSRWRPNLGRGLRELKSGKNVPVLVSQEMYLPIPEWVSGPNYEAGLAEWEQQVQFWTGIVRDADVKACNHCSGHGYVLDAPDTNPA
ncbi:hypothetical protein PV726_32900 [Streptomyces europaeiscabiei]|uniref:hypothetical protein n=1 Tax=Streptomyces europaeiscabiei TaxID=146819 RepID=UPI0029AF5968|nr:hypothetical protein [Streptomyces europaeiscabiei]MDX3695054.1 hypothetical protein [Streptomyces europaeiscabiei]